MKKLLYILLHRSVFVTLALLAQIAALAVVVVSFSATEVFYWCCIALSVAAAVAIVGSRMDPGYKIAWLLLILPFPIFGGVFYLMVGGGYVPERTRKRMKGMLEKSFFTLKEDFKSDDLLPLGGDAAGQASYLERRAACPAYTNTETEYFPLGDEAFPRMLEELEKATPSDVSEEKAALQAAIASATAKRNNAQKRIEEEQNNLNEINEKLNKYQDRLKDSSEELEKLQTNKAKEEGIKDSTDASRLTSAARNELSANNNLSNLNAQMTKDEINEGKAGIRAEFSGVVTEVTAVAGGPAAKGGSLFTVASNEDVVVDMSVTRFDLEKLEVGQSAEINLAGKTYTGKVSKLSRLAAENSKGTPVVSAEIHIDNPDENIYLGLEAKVAVSGRKAENVVVVPVEAVNTGVDGSFCYVVDENGVVAVREVVTGLASSMEVEIQSGLSAGDKVIRNTTGMLVEEGMRVTAVEE